MAKAAGELFFIALVPPEPVFSQALAYKEFMAEKFHTKAALNSPPHVTLHMPFRMKVKKVKTLIQEMTESLSEFPQFRVDLDGFGSFAPRVIYIQAEKTGELQQLYDRVRHVMKRTLLIDNADWKNRGFTPHLTIAFRDLGKSSFHAAWEEVKGREFKAGWEVAEVCLLKHDGQKWQEFHRFGLSESE